MNTSNNDTPDTVPEDLPSHAADHLTRPAAPWLVRGLDALTVLVAVAAVFAIGRWSIPLPGGGAIRAGAPMDINPRGPIGPTSLPADVQVVSYNAWLPGPSDVVDYLLRAAEVLPSALILLLILRLLRTVVSSISHGEPFTDGNAFRICVMGASLVIGTPVALITTAIATQLQITRAELDGDVIVTLDVLDVVFPVLGGVLLLILGGVFKMGVRMRTDVEGLV